MTVKKKRGTSDKLNKLTMIEKSKREMQFELRVGEKLWMKSFLMNEMIWYPSGKEHKRVKDTKMYKTLCSVQGIIIVYSWKT